MLAKHAPYALALALVSLVGCAEEGERAGAPEVPKPVEAPASRPAGAATGGLGGAGRDDANYVVDGPLVPERVGVRRIFMRQPKVTVLRDPAFLPDGKDVVFIAKVGGVNGLWRMPIDGSRPAELVVPTPLFDPNAPRTARNRQNWYLGTPRVFPDGKHVLFEGTSPNPYEQFANTIGIVPIEGGIIKAAVATGVKSVRTPDVHPDGETVVFASCDQLRVGKLKGRDDQEFETTALVTIPKVQSSHEGVCTVHRPRFSPDGKHVVFEALGKFMTDEFKKQYSVPESVNPGDYVIEPWIVGSDGSGLRRLISDEAYKTIAGRVQSGGVRDPVFSPDGQRVAFTHGDSIAVVTVDGKQARVVAHKVVPTANPAETGSPIMFDEDDPAFSPDGKVIVSASKLSKKDVAPPGLAVIDLEKIDASAPAAAPAPSPEGPLDPAKASP